MLLKEGCNARKVDKVLLSANNFTTHSFINIELLPATGVNG